MCVRVCVYTGEKGSAKGAALGGAATAATARRNDIVKEVLAVQDNTHTRAYWGRQLTPGSGSRKQGTLKQAIWECCCQIGTQLAPRRYPVPLEGAQTQPPPTPTGAGHTGHEGQPHRYCRTRCYQFEVMRYELYCIANRVPLTPPSRSTRGSCGGTNYVIVG